MEGSRRCEDRSDEAEKGNLNSAARGETDRLSRLARDFLNGLPPTAMSYVVLSEVVDIALQVCTLLADYLAST